MNFLEQKIKKEFKNIFFKLYELEIALDEIVLEIPPKKDLGDYCLASFGISKILKKSPVQIGQEIIDFVKVNSINNQLFQEMQMAGPYLNFRIDKTIIISLISEYNSNKSNENNKGKTIFVDYIGANVGKPLHIGHMCTPNQGQVMINLYKRLGFTVISDSHIGDWGIIFGKLIFAYKMWGDSFKLEENPIDYLLELYVKATNEAETNLDLEDEFRKEFKLLSMGNSESVELWRLFTKYSIDATQFQLSRLNIQPTYNIGESFYEGLELPKMGDYPDLKYNMKSIVNELIEKNIATKNDDGSVGVVFDEKLKIPSCVLQKRDGTHGYLASDLASVKYRVENWNPQDIIYFVDVRQQLHLKQVFEISRMAGWLNLGKDKNSVRLFHAYNGFISLKDGAMSTRKGRIIKLDKLLDEAEDRARKIILEKRQDLSEEELTKLAKTIGIGAIKYGYLSKNRTTDVIFDWDEFMTFEGNSGPYIQYAYVRARKILEKSSVKDYVISDLGNEKEKIKDELLNLIKILLRYNSSDGVLVEAAEKNMPHILAGYTYELTKAFNGLYNNVDILGEKNDKIKNILLKVTEEFTNVIKGAFEILGIDLPERM